MEHPDRRRRDPAFSEDCAQDCAELQRRMSIGGLHSWEKPRFSAFDAPRGRMYNLSQGAG